MGAIVDSESLERAAAFDLDAHLQRNDSAAVFRELGDQLLTGHTGTNVNDMTIVLVTPRQPQ